MEDVFGPDLLDADARVRLLNRSNGASARRLLAHLTCVVVALVAAAVTSGTPWVVIPTLAQAFFLGTLFAPFHECTHGTAFATPACNRWGATLTGMLFGTSWHAYRAFHFQHHAHTQDPEKDPEIMLDPHNLSPWPDTPLRWLATLSGIRLLTSKLTSMVSCWIPGPGTRFANLPGIARMEGQITALFWIAVLTAALVNVPGALALLVAFVLAHVVEGVWLTTEHTGRSNDGSIFDRTRTVRSNALVRFFLWNMNYHSEHHGWPGVPWHALPSLHEQLGDVVETHPGYLQVYRREFASGH